MSEDINGRSRKEDSQRFERWAEISALKLLARAMIVAGVPFAMWLANTLMGNYIDKMDEITALASETAAVVAEVTQEQRVMAPFVERMSNDLNDLDERIDKVESSRFRKEQGDELRFKVDVNTGRLFKLETDVENLQANR